MQNETAQVGCGHNGCGACCGGGCSSGCSGCGGALQLTQGELDLLGRFAQIPFLPVARRSDTSPPVYREEGAAPEGEAAQIVAALQQKQLIRLDYDLPLLGFDYGAYSDCPQRGSMALTARGQQTIEQLEIHGIEEL